MFTFFGGKKKTTHGEPHQPSNPAPPQDDFVFLNEPQDRTSQPDNRPLYPNMNIAGMPAMPEMKQPVRKDVHFLQDVPFKINKEFSSASSNDIMAMHISEIMAYCTRNLQLDNLDYDFSVERSVLLES